MRLVSKQNIKIVRLWEELEDSLLIQYEYKDKKIISRILDMDLCDNKRDLYLTLKPLKMNYQLPKRVVARDIDAVITDCGTPQLIKVLFFKYA